jgi:thiosulfate/3-mercaptopyruvate sulfurtransferase
MHTTLISPDELRHNLNTFAVFDCRFNLNDTEAMRRAYLESHIAGAIYAHLDEDMSGIKNGRNGRHPLPTPDSLRATFSKWGIDSQTQVVAYDDTGGGIAAARLWWMLCYMGHQRAAILNGGWNTWLKLNYPTRSGSETRAAKTFSGDPHPSMIADADSLSAFTLIDARAAPRYRGDEEPIDRVPGHIPSAKNFYWGDNLAPDQTLLSPDQLRAKYESILKGKSPDRVVCYCGSGVSAAMDVLAMEVAGLKDVKLYPGSWSEWSSDESRAVAKGSE